MLDDLLQYHSQPGAGPDTALQPDGFVNGVMRAVERQQRLRRRILLLCGLVGAVFGLLGASLMTDTLVQFSTQVFATDHALTSGAVIVLLLAVLVWLLHDEPVLSL